MQASRPDGEAHAFVQKLGQEDGDARKFLYRVKFSRLLFGTLAAAGGALRDAASLSRQLIGRLV